jgi:RimJ/RimL family protein N-acetyltransferase
MKRVDIEAMAQWRPMADPLYQPFDLPEQSVAEHMRWFNWRSNDPTRRLYAVENVHRQVIGSLTLREIDGRRSSRLGITLGADYVSQGYGTEALRLFLDHYFGKMDFERMVLDVAGTNLRAQRCYEALGFHRIGQHYRHADHQSYYLIAREPNYRHLRSVLHYEGAELEVLFYDMALTRDEWRRVRQSKIQG